MDYSRVLLEVMGSVKSDPKLQAFEKQMDRCSSLPYGKVGNCKEELVKRWNMFKSKSKPQRYVPTVSEIRSIAKKNYKRHLADVIVQFKKDVAEGAKESPWKKMIPTSYFNVESQISKMDLDEGDSGEQTEQHLYTFSTAPTLESQDDLRDITLKNGIRINGPELILDVVSKNDGSVSMRMLSQFGFYYKDDYWYPAYTTKLIYTYPK
jgi:hypothetical protein